MPTALIADDETNLSSDLASRLNRFWPELEIVAKPRNGVEALAEINRLRPDIVFLDVRMPGVDGMQIACTTSDIRIVFITAYDEYAVPAFETSALDFLLKPVTDERLLKCIAKLQRERRRAAVSTPPNRVDMRGSAAPIQWLTVGCRDGTRLVSVEEVHYFRAADKYTEVVTAEKRYIIRTPLKELQQCLDPARFAQVHRSVIVALAVISHVEREVDGRQFIHLKNRLELLPVSRGSAAMFRQM